MSIGESTGRGFRALLFVALGWVILAAFLAVQLWPDLPKSKIQWILLVAFGPPLYVLAEGLVEWLLSTRHGEPVSPSEVSGKRIVLALPLVLLIFLVSWWLSWLISKP